MSQRLLRFPTSLRTTGTPFEEAAKSRPLLAHGGVNQSPEPSLGDQTFWKGVAERGECLDDARIKLQEVENLSHAGTGNAEPSGEVSRVPKLPFFQAFLPIQSQNDRV
jgi:hypothetical protein